MSFRGLDAPDSGNPGKMDLGEPRRFGGGMMDNKGMDDSDDRRFDMGGRGRRPPFGRGRPSPFGRDKPRDFGFGRNDSSIRDRSPMHGSDDSFNDRYKKDDGGFKRDDMGRKDQGRPYFGGDSRDRYMDRPSRMDGPGGYSGSRFDGPNDSYKTPRSMNYSAPPKPFFSEGFPKPNECEIIAVNKHQRAYAESVEARIKDLGILVDVLFLKDEALLTQTIDDIAQRGSLYAMVISPQNETHRSVTVNILHGTPQEHRNMPLEDALKLVSRNFHEHIRLQKENMERERVKRGPYSGVVAADREMQLLLRMLADGRWISLGEITAVIRYLTERRDKMQTGGVGEERSVARPPLPATDLSKLETTQFKPMPKDDIDVAQKEQDLQNRIINIMNQGVPAVGSTTESGLGSNASGLDLPASRPSQPGLGIHSTLSGIKSTNPSQDSLPGLEPKSSGIGDASSLFPPASTQSTTSTYLNFNNPTVQKALDDLMQSGPNILKNISLSSSVSPQNTVTATTAKTTIGSGMGLGNDSLGMPRGGMPPARGPGSGMSDMQGQSRGNLDMGPPRGPVDIGSGPRGMGRPSPQRDLGSGLQRDLGSGLQRDLGSGLQRDLGSGLQRDLGSGLQRGPGNMSDIRGPSPPRDMGGPRGSDMMGGMGPPRGGYGSSGSEGIGGMRSFGGGSSGMSDQSMGPPPRMNDMGRMGGPPHGMGNNFSGQNQNQFNKFPGGPGSFPASYNSNMPPPRQNYNQGMGGGPRRY